TPTTAPVLFRPVAAVLVYPGAESSTVTRCDGTSRPSRASMLRRHDAVRFRAGRGRRTGCGRTGFGKDCHHMIASPSVCGRMTATCPGAQTERRGGAGPARGLLGGKKTAPAALCFGLGGHRKTRAVLQLDGTDSDQLTSCHQPSARRRSCFF